MTATGLLLDGLASYRLARLLTMDDLTKGPRDRLWKWASDREHHKLAELITCPHCVGTQAALVIALVGPMVRGWRPLRDALAVAGLASLAATVAGALEAE